MNTQITTENETHQPQVIPTTIRRIVLAGFMGAGKTTIGRLLAERLGWTFADLDHLIEAHAGKTVPQVFAEDGEEKFRRLESTVLARALSSTNTVLALGGGAPESLTNRLLLEQTPGTLVVFLSAPFPVLFDRCMLEELNPQIPGQTRPVLADPVAAEKRFATRQPHYRRLAKITLDTTEFDQAAAVNSLVEKIASL